MPLALADVPVELGRDEAARLAVQELADPAYHVDDPGLVERGIRWVVDRLGELVDRAAGSLPGGRWGLLALVVLAAIVLGFVLWRAGPVRRSSSSATALFVGRAKTAADHRQEADRASAQGRWEDAVLERYRAIVRALEERTILDPQTRAYGRRGCARGRPCPAGPGCRPVVRVHHLRRRRLRRSTGLFDR